jgi:hypothetical protein
MGIEKLKEKFEISFFEDVGIAKIDVAVNQKIKDGALKTVCKQIGDKDLDLIHSISEEIEIMFNGSLGLRLIPKK